MRSSQGRVGGGMEYGMAYSSKLENQYILRPVSKKYIYFLQFLRNFLELSQDILCFPEAQAISLASIATSHPHEFHRRKS